MISEVDENMSGSIDFGEFVKVVESQKKRAENFDDENDMVSLCCRRSLANQIVTNKPGSLD